MALRPRTRARAAGDDDPFRQLQMRVLEENWHRRTQGLPPARVPHSEWTRAVIASTRQRPTVVPTLSLDAQQRGGQASGQTRRRPADKLLKAFERFQRKTRRLSDRAAARPFLMKHDPNWSRMTELLRERRVVAFLRQVYRARRRSASRKTSDK